MLKQGKCLFCLRETLVAPLEAWDGKGRTKWYCQDHYSQVSAFHHKQMNAFLDAYDDEANRKSLSPENLALYHQLRQMKGEMH